MQLPSKQLPSNMKSPLALLLLVLTLGANVTIADSRIDEFTRLTKDSAYLVVDIDLNQDGRVDKVISSASHQGNALYFYMQQSDGRYRQAFKGHNLSMDGDLVHRIKPVTSPNKQHVFSITIFVMGGKNSREEFIAYDGSTWFLAHTKYENNYWQKQTYHSCDIPRNIPLSDLSKNGKGWKHYTHFGSDDFDTNKWCTKTVNVFDSDQYFVKSTCKNEYDCDLHITNKKTKSTKKIVDCANPKDDTIDNHDTHYFASDNSQVDPTGRYLMIGYDNTGIVEDGESQHRHVMPRCAMLDLKTASLIHEDNARSKFCSQEQPTRPSASDWPTQNIAGSAQQLQKNIKKLTRNQTTAAVDYLLCHSQTLEERKAFFPLAEALIDNAEHFNSERLRKHANIRLTPGVYTAPDCSHPFYLGEDNYAIYSDKYRFTEKLEYSKGFVSFKGFKGEVYDGKDYEIGDMGGQIVAPDQFSTQNYGNAMNPFTYLNGCSGKYSTFSLQKNALTIRRKAHLYTSSFRKTKMYLIAGDVVTLLKQKTDNQGQQWVFINYKGKKPLTMWLKADAVDSTTTAASKIGYFQFTVDFNGSTQVSRHGVKIPFTPQSDNFFKPHTAKLVDLDNDGVPEVEINFSNLGGMKNVSLTVYYRYDAAKKKLIEIPSKHSLHQITHKPNGYLINGFAATGRYYEELIRYHPKTGEFTTVFLDEQGDEQGDAGVNLRSTGGTQSYQYYVDNNADLAKRQRKPLPATIKRKSYLFSAPNKRSNMYLIKGDKVSLLGLQREAAAVWYLIRFKGKKDLKMWVKPEAIEDKQP